MSVKRWVITDPHDTNVATKSYTFPINPRDMTSPYKERSITAQGTARGRILFFEGAAQAKQWQFSGPILDKAHMDALRLWVYNRPGRVIITDHYGRVIECILQSLDVTPKRRLGYYYSHEYTITAMITAISAPTVPNLGPGA